MINTYKQEERYDLSALIKYYELSNRAEGKSPKTIAWYTSNLDRFYRYLKERHLSNSIGELNIIILREYVLYLIKQRKYENHPYTPVENELLSPASVHGHVRTLRAFFSWLFREGIIDNNIAKDLKPPKVTRKVVSTLSDQEISNILRCFNSSDGSQSRNQTIFMLLLDTGLRIGELINLKAEDVHMDEGFLKVIGKGKKERIVPMGKNAQRVLQRYLFRYKFQPAYPGTKNVFLSTQGKPLTENSIKLMFARLAKRSGVYRLHAHLCRHTFATRFLINGGDIFSLQQILGHSTLEMVRHYINLASNHVVVQHQRFSPLDHIRL
jgi:site-specific recombinase XerD